MLPPRESVESHAVCQCYSATWSLSFAFTVSIGVCLANVQICATPNGLQKIKNNQRKSHEKQTQNSLFKYPQGNFKVPGQNLLGRCRLWTLTLGYQPNLLDNMFSATGTEKFSPYPHTFFDLKSNSTLQNKTGFISYLG